MRFLVCPPTYYGIEYSINPWMSTVNKSNRHEASLQWQRLVEIIHLLGHEILEIQPHIGLPDLVFTANAGLIWKNKAIVSSFKHQERQGETQHFQKWFEDHDFETIVAPGEFEGAGDALFAGERLFMGYGFRSELGMKAWFELEGIKDVVPCRLLNPHFYHLDTCFCPLNDHQILLHSPAIDIDFDFADYDLIEVSENEAMNFACNAVVLDKAVIMPTGCPETKQKLEDAGFGVVTTEMTEFIKAGGACKCLTLRV